MSFDFQASLASEKSFRKILAREAEKNLHPTVWNYIRAGALDEQAALDAFDSWNDVKYLPKSLTSVKEVETSFTIFGHEYSAPFGFAPSALQRAAAPAGELALAAVAYENNLPYCVSAASGWPFAKIAEVNPDWWAQFYITEDRSQSIPMMERALAAGAKAIVLTVDAPVIGNKYDVGNNDWDDLDISWHRCNYEGLAGDQQRGQWAPDLRIDDLVWLKETCGIPLIAKGVMNPQSAYAMVQAGVDAIWVSNHGGRQHARAASTRSALPLIKNAAGSVPILVDGGIYNGLDVAAAVALGADVAMAGRQPVYALAAGGQDTLAQITRLVLDELRETLSLSGVTSHKELALIKI